MSTRQARRPAGRAPAQPDEIASRYAEVAYPAQPHFVTHPRRLAVVARLAGLEAAPIDHCRVLEVGCGSGTNLLGMAVALPESEFVGFDLTREPIAIARRLAAEARLRNVRFFAADLREIGPDFGTFDYVIAHGVYSWVPAEVRTALMRLCKERLKPNGVAYISFMALPGGRIFRMLREMLLWHTAEETEPMARVAEARRFAEMLASAPPRPGSSGAYHELIVGLVRGIMTRDASYVFHDHMATINEPFSITEFAAAAAEAGLQYLGESQPSGVVEAALPPELTAIVDACGDDIIAREQYLDYLQGRQFRTTLLCHDAVVLDRRQDPGTIRGLHAWTGMRHAREEEGATVFESERLGEVAIARPVGRAAMQALVETAPDSLPFAELLARVQARLTTLDPDGIDGDPAEVLADFLHFSQGAGVVELHTLPLHHVAQPAERPLASPLARAQARAGEELTTLRHGRLRLDDDASLQLLLALDGTRDRPALAATLASAGYALAPEEIDERLASLAAQHLLVR